MHYTLVYDLVRMPGPETLWTFVGLLLWSLGFAFMPIVIVLEKKVRNQRLTRWDSASPVIVPLLALSVLCLVGYDYLTLQRAYFSAAPLIAQGDVKRFTVDSSGKFESFTVGGVAFDFGCCEATAAYHDMHGPIANGVMARITYFHGGNFRRNAILRLEVVK